MLDSAQHKDNQQSFYEMNKENNKLLEQMQIHQLFARWMASQMNLKGDEAEQYTLFIIECAKQINDEEVLVEMAYCELKRHLGLEDMAPTSKDDIRTALHRYQDLLHVPMFPEYQNADNDKPQ